MRLLPFLAATMILFVAAPVWATTITVTIDKLEFTPKEVSLKEGDKIVWVNNDAFAHTATVKGKDGWEVMIPPKKSASRVMKDAGSIDYFCRFHPNMTGRITISAP